MDKTLDWFVLDSETTEHLRISQILITDYKKKSQRSWFYWLNKHNSNKKNTLRQSSEMSSHLLNNEFNNNNANNKIHFKLIVILDLKLWFKKIPPAILNCVLPSFLFKCSMQRYLDWQLLKYLWGCQIFVMSDGVISLKRVENHWAKLSWSGVEGTARRAWAELHQHPPPHRNSHHMIPY